MGVQHTSAAETLTVRAAPARVLKRVAVMTRFFLGSTAPTATSGVSTTATSFGGAVSTAARPNRTANGESLKAETGVPVRGEPIIDVGVMGPLEMLSERRPLGPVREDAGLLLVELASDCRR